MKFPKKKSFLGFYLPLSGFLDDNENYYVEESLAVSKESLEEEKSSVKGPHLSKKPCKEGCS